MDAAGPVTVVSKTQVATGDRGSYDKDQNKVWLFGNVTLSDGGNVTKGDKLTYDLTTGEAVVEGEGQDARGRARSTRLQRPRRDSRPDYSARIEPSYRRASDTKPAQKKTPKRSRHVKP